MDSLVKNTMWMGCMLYSLVRNAMWMGCMLKFDNKGVLKVRWPKLECNTPSFKIL